MVLQMFFSQAAGSVTTNFLGIIIKVSLHHYYHILLVSDLRFFFRASDILHWKLSYSPHQTTPFKPSCKWSFPVYRLLSQPSVTGNNLLHAYPAASLLLVSPFFTSPHHWRSTDTVDLPAVLWSPSRAWTILLSCPLSPQMWAVSPRNRSSRQRHFSCTALQTSSHRRPSRVPKLLTTTPV